MKKDGAIGKQFTKEGAIGEAVMFLRHLAVLSLGCAVTWASDLTNYFVGGTAQKAGEKAEGLGKKMEGEEKAKK